MTNIVLSSGLNMPIIGLGTFKTRGKDLVYSVLDAALKAGYRSIDTAGCYRNEEQIGECLEELLPKYGLNRSDIFITSKLAPKDHGQGKCREACLKSISDLKTDYLDLYLIHWPGVQGKKPEDITNKDIRLKSWQDMEQLHKEGKVKSIGVSNYGQTHLEELLSKCSIRPEVLQIEHHPHLVQQTLVDFCFKNKIQFQAYSSLGTMSEDKKLLTDPAIVQLAESYCKSPAQILLRWAVQQGIGVIPKSTNPEHIKNNIDIFSFSLKDCDMSAIGNLDTQHHYCWNPSSVL